MSEEKITSKDKEAINKKPGTTAALGVVGQFASTSIPDPGLPAGAVSSRFLDPDEATQDEVISQLPRDLVREVGAYAVDPAEPKPFYGRFGKGCP